MANIHPRNKTMPLTVAIVSGHSKRSQGARSVNGSTEWDWNNLLADKLAAELVAMGVQVARLERPSKGYTESMQKLTDMVNLVGATCALELHFDASSNPEAYGCSALYWPSSTAGETLATYVSSACSRAVKTRNRGPSARQKSWTGAPLHFLRATKCPAVIVESHFGSNPSDHRAATQARDDGTLARELARAVVQWWQDWTARHD